MSEVVYVLQDYHDYDEFEIVGVFTSREKAYHARKQMQLGESYTTIVLTYPLDVVNPDIEEEFDNENL